jgi:hypothetical protein
VFVLGHPNATVTFQSTTTYVAENIVQQFDSPGSTACISEDPKVHIHTYM